MEKETYHKLESLLVAHIDAATNDVNDDMQKEHVRRAVQIANILKGIDDNEASHAEAREKLAIDRSRLDLETERSQAEIAINSDRLDFETQRFNVETTIRRETNDIERAKLKNSIVGEIVKGILGGCRIGQAYIALRDAFAFESEGVISSPFSKKVISDTITPKI